MNIEAPAVLDTGLALKFLRVLWPAEWFDQYDIPAPWLLRPLNKTRRAGNLCALIGFLRSLAKKTLLVASSESI